MTSTPASMPKTPDLSHLSFEQAMAELEKIVRLLEEGKLPLEQAIQAFSKGSTLKQYCEDKLKNAKLKVDQIMMGADGQITLSPFDNDKK